MTDHQAANEHQTLSNHQASSDHPARSDGHAAYGAAPYPVLFFDGECNLCNGAVDFCLRYEKAPALRFASLQSPYAREVLGADAGTLSTLVLYENGMRYTRSDAVWRIATYLRAPWSASTYLRFVPRAVRDAGYRLIAASRYRIFGKRSCRIAQGPQADRFL